MGLWGEGLTGSGCSLLMGPSGASGAPSTSLLALGVGRLPASSAVATVGVGCQLPTPAGRHGLPCSLPSAEMTSGLSGTLLGAVSPSSAPRPPPTGRGHDSLR